MKRESTILAVVSGKGGVGKSVIAVNLAEALTKEGHRVALVDVDLGQSACGVLMNETPDATVMDLLRLTARTQQVMHKSASGVTIVQASDAAGESDGRETELYSSLDEILSELRRSHEYILIDAPAGTNGAVRWALDRADLGLLVIVGEPTAVADAYRLARMTWKSDPAFPFATITNFAESELEAEEIADRFARISEHFTGRLPSYLGWVPFSRAIRQSVTQQTPVVRKSGPASEAFKRLAQTMVSGRITVGESLNVR